MNFARAKLKLVLVNTHDPCQNAIVRSQRVNFSADWLIRKERNKYLTS